MRDFARTPEPAGQAARAADGGPRRYVVQRHRATRLHYDFRLEIDGVLVSWAVPKGPTLDPGVRRAAFHVEDHPIEYFDFEGVIPAGQYGGGDVVVWDAGTWTPHAHKRGADRDPRQAVEDGELHFDMHGEKLHGRFALVRTRRGRSGKDEWLLLHKRDEYAAEGWDAEDHPHSVLTGRTNDEVKADPDRLWRSGAPAARAAVVLRSPPVDDDELAALDDLPATGSWTVFGRRLRVTNLDKVLFPPRPGEEPVTKRDLLRYTAQIAPTLLPYLSRRALNMHRYPNGAHTRGFWHKELPDHAPEWLPRWDNPDADAGETCTYLVVDEPAALVWAANFGALEWHPWTSRVDEPQRPTYAPGCTGTRSPTSGSPPAPRSPAAAASRSGCRSRPARASTRRGRGWSGCPARSARWCRSWSAGSGRRTTAAGSRGWTTRRTRSTRRWSRRTARGPRPARRCPRRSSGTSSTTRTCGRTGSPSAASYPGSPNVVTCSATCWTIRSGCRRCAEEPTGRGCGSDRPRRWDP
jgi:DNA ligase D-like protein (predicted 3'-phosphoesterase)